MDGGSVRKAVTTAIMGVLVAVLVAFLLSRFFRPVEAQTDYLLLGVGVVGIVLLVLQSVRSRSRMPDRAGELVSGDKSLEGAMTAAVMVLLLFTSMLSGPSLLLVPVVAIGLVIVYILLKRRQG
jgi:4-hydroxybenzoate polyprenyltransferase